MEAKIGITYENTNQILFKIDKNKSLQENINLICKEFELESNQPYKRYGLKFNYAKNNVSLNNYVTEENFHAIQDGYTFLLVDSLEYVVDQIFSNLLGNRNLSFNYLYTLSLDPGFIDILVQTDHHEDVLRWLTDKYLQGKELSACLLTLLHLLKKQLIKELRHEVVENIIMVVKNNTPPTELQYALAVLCQILFQNGHHESKELIITKLSIKKLLSFIRSQEHTKLQLNTLMLINAMVKSLKGEKRIQIINELNKYKNKECIFNNIIKYEVDSLMSRELYICQTYILSLYSDALHTYIDLNDQSLLKKLEISEDTCNSGEYLEQRVRRCHSNDTILEENDFRISFASIESDKSILTNFSCNINLDDKISSLTYDSLIYYKLHYKTQYTQSLAEERTYESGLLFTGEKITKLLSNTLHIGSAPQKGHRFFLPLIFNSSLQLPFFYELFSRTMWLLSKNRREMKAWIPNDFPKLVAVLEKQIKMVLNMKPIDYKMLSENMMKINYNDVDQQWQKEKAAQWKLVYEENPNVQILKKQFNSKNEELVIERRLKILQKGDFFPKLPEKKGKERNFFLRLSENLHIIYMEEYNDISKIAKPKTTNYFNISDIKYLIVGKSCPHVKNNNIKDPTRTFSLVLDENIHVNCVSKDANTAKIWIDGFNYLLNKSFRSEDYYNELKVLVEMDCALHLLELQEIELPNVPPYIPPLPKELRSKPVVPPKSPMLCAKLKVKKKSAIKK